MAPQRAAATLAAREEGNHPLPDVRVTESRVLSRVAGWWVGHVGRGVSRSRREY